MGTLQKPGVISGLFYYMDIHNYPLVSLRAIAYFSSILGPFPSSFSSSFSPEPERGILREGSLPCNLSFLIVRRVRFAMKRRLFFCAFFLFLYGSGFAQKMTVEDSDSNILMEVNDEGTVGSITLPAGFTPAATANKLYNVSGSLFWNGSALGTAGSAGGWTDGGGSIHTTTSWDKVGIGTSAPEFNLSLNGGGIIAKGMFGTDTTLTTSSVGTRLIWYPKKAAFRAGYVGGDQWNEANVGAYSTATGKSTTASGEGSTAMGRSNTASGASSTAMGSSNTASGAASTAMGAFTSASGDNSTALGSSTAANGRSSTAMGNSTIASGDESTAMGVNTVASHYSSTAIGCGTTASGVFSTAMGRSTTAGSWASMAIGQGNVGGGTADSWVSSDPIFEIGIGADEGPPKTNAVTVLKNGKVGVGTATPNALLTVQNESTTDWNEMLDIIAPNAADGVHTSGIIFGR